MEIPIYRVYLKNGKVIFASFFVPAEWTLQKSEGEIVKLYLDPLEHFHKIFDLEEYDDRYMISVNREDITKIEFLELISMEEAEDVHNQIISLTDEELAIFKGE